MSLFRPAPEGAGSPIPWPLLQYVCLVLADLERCVRVPFCHSQLFFIYKYIHIYIYIYMVTPPQGLPFYFLHERDLFADVQCPLGLQMPCRKHCNLRCFCALFDIVSDVLSILDAKQDSRKQQTRKRKAFSDATLSVFKTLLVAVILKKTAKKNLFLTFFDGFSLKTCTGSKNCKKIQTWKLQNLHRLNKNAKNAKPRYNVRGQGLIGLDFCICCILFEPVQVLEPWMFKTCTGSKKCKKCKSQMQCQRSGLDWSGLLHFLHFLSLCSLGCLKPAQAQKNVKKSKPGSSKTCTGSKKCKKCKTQMQCQRSGLEWSGLLHFLHFLEPVQVLRRPGLDFFAFF